MAGLLVDTWHHVLEVRANAQQHLEDQELVGIRANYRTIIDAAHEANPAPAPTGRRGRPK